MTRNPDSTTETGKPMRVAAYIRVSSARQANEGDSLTAQRNEIEQELDYRRRRDNWKVEHVEFYVDAGRSAKDQNRTHLQRLKRDTLEGKVDVVICFKLDRITRSLSDFVSLWQMFDQQKVDVISLREKFDTSMPTGRAMLSLIMVFAQLEREMTAERTYAIMKDRVDRGLWNGGHVLGYRTDPTDKGKLLIEEEGAAIVRRIFDLFEDLGSAGAVTRKLNDLGIRYPKFVTRDEKVRGGKLFVKQKVIGILRNRVYLGEIHWGKSNQDDCHEPIISIEQFDRVQLRLKLTTKRRQNLRQSKGRRYLLTGLLRCQCGAHMVGAAAHGRNGVYQYYVCTKQNHEGGKHSCQAPRLPADALEHTLLERLREIGTLTEARERVVRRALECLDTESGKLQEEEEIIRRQLVKVKADAGRLVEVLKTMGTKGIVSVQEELERLEREEKELRANLGEIQRRQEPMLRVSEEAKQFLETWTNVGDMLDQVSPDERFLILQHYVELVEFRAGDEKGKKGTYVIRLFPEVRPNRDDLEPPLGNGVPNDPHPPETPNGAAAATGNDPDLLTENGVVRTAVQKAPRLGLEPRT